MAITKEEIIEQCDTAIAGYITLLNEALADGDMDVDADKVKCLSNITNIIRATSVKEYAEANL